MKIYIDDREKTPWDFSIYNFEQERIRLDVGDYYIEELPDLIIERKASTGEIAINLGSKWSSFEKELKKMKDYKYSYIICEFPFAYFDCFPEKSGIPDNKFNKIRMNGSFMKSRLFNEAKKYNINVLFFENAQMAQSAVIDIINNQGLYNKES